MMSTSVFRLIGCGLISALLCFVPLSAESTALEAVEKSAGDWLKVRAERARLETEWSSQRQLLDSMVRGLNERAQSLETKRDYLRAKTAKERDELGSLENSNKKMSAGLQAVDSKLDATSKALLQLRASLPPRLSTSLELPFKSLAGNELTMSERMQLTTTVLNRCLQFNRSIVCEDEVLTLPGESGARQVEVIYWGLAQGYALDRGAQKVWLGIPASAGWQWQPVADVTERVAKLIAIHRGKMEPQFIELPFKPQNDSPNR